MITINADPQRRLVRDADRAMLGGVCAGLAAYLGFNLKVTRCLAFIAFLMAMPLAVVAYLAAVFLIPSASNLDGETEEFICRRRRSRKARKARKKQKDSEPTVAPRQEAAADIDRRCRSLDERLVRLEKLVTSRRFQLEQELSRL